MQQAERQPSQNVMGYKTQRSLGGRPPGTSNKDKPWRAAIVRRLKIADGDPRELDIIADELVRAAQAGNLEAISMIADRLDGKPSQEVTGDLTQRLEVIVTGVIRDDSQPVTQLLPTLEHQPSNTNDIKGLDQQEGCLPSTPTTPQQDD